MVLLVLGIAAGMAIPMLGQTDGTRLAEAARLIEADLAYAQVESISHADDPRVVVFDPANNRYHVAPASAMGTSIANPVGGGAYRTTFGKGRAAELGGVRILSVVPASTPANTLRFGVYGQLCAPGDPTSNSGADAVITLRCGNQTATLTVDDVTGDVTISDVF